MQQRKRDRQQPVYISAGLLASQRPKEMVLFPNTNYFLPPTICSVGALLLLPDSVKSPATVNRGQSLMVMFIHGHPFIFLL